MGEIQAITMPKFGLAMTEGMLAAWYKAEGESVSPGEELADIETTKITNAFESPVGGTLRRRVVEEGETVPVGALIGVLAEPSEPEDAIDGFVKDFQANFVPPETSEEGEEGPRSQIAETPQGAINYLELGSGEDPPVVLIHGFGGDLNNWMFVQPDLAEQKRTIAVDLPGHGGSVKRVGAGDATNLAGALEALMDVLALERAHLVGHSLGGAVALDLAQSNPKRVESLILIAPVGLGPDINMDYVSGFLSAKRRKQMKPVLEMLFADPHLVGKDMVEDILKFKRLDGVVEALSTLAERSFDEGRQTLDYRKVLETAGRPVQVIWGEEDRIIPVHHTEGLPGSVTVTHLPRTGHMAHMEQAAEVVRLISKWTAT